MKKRICLIIFFILCISVLTSNVLAANYEYFKNNGSRVTLTTGNNGFYIFHPNGAPSDGRVYQTGGDNIDSPNPTFFGYYNYDWMKRSKILEPLSQTGEYAEWVKFARYYEVYTEIEYRLQKGGNSMDDLIFYRSLLNDANDETYEKNMCAESTLTDQSKGYPFEDPLYKLACTALDSPTKEELYSIRHELVEELDQYKSEGFDIQYDDYDELKAEFEGKRDDLLLIRQVFDNSKLTYHKVMKQICTLEAYAPEACKDYLPEEYEGEMRPSADDEGDKDTNTQLDVSAEDKGWWLAARDFFQNGRNNRPNY